MTVSSTTTSVSYSGNGSTTAFAVTFPFFEITVEEIILNTLTELVSGTDYSVTGGSGSTGTVIISPAPASGTTIRIRRTTDRKQLVDFSEGDGFPAEAHEKALDRLAMIAQELGGEISDVAGLPDSLTEIVAPLEDDDMMIVRRGEVNFQAPAILTLGAGPLSIYSILPYAVGQRIKAGTKTDEDLHEAINEVTGNLAASQGGAIELGAGFIPYNGAIIQRTGVSFFGNGWGCSGFFHLSGANSDGIVGEGYDDLDGTDTTGGVSKFMWSKFSVDGNHDNNTSGDLFKFYGFDFVISNVHGFRGPAFGMVSEWGTGASPTPTVDANAHAVIDNLVISNCNNRAMSWNGPHDAKFGTVMLSQSKGVHATTPANDGPADCLAWIGPKGGASIFAALHTHSNATRQVEYDVIIDGGYNEFNYASLEGGHLYKLWLRDGGNNFVFGGKLFHNNPGANNTAGGVKIGNSTGPTYSTNNHLRFFLQDLGGPVVKYDAASDQNMIWAHGYSNASVLAAEAFNGTPQGDDDIDITIVGASGVRDQYRKERMHTLNYASSPSSGAIGVGRGNTVVTNTGATALVVIPMPAPVKGAVYRFLVEDGDGIQLDLPPGVTASVRDSFTTSGGTITATTVGSYLKLEAISATRLISADDNGDWVCA